MTRMRNYARPMFQHRHYEAVAELISKVDYCHKVEMAEDFVAMFKADNPRFSPERFRTKAGTLGQWRKVREG